MKDHQPSPCCRQTSTFTSAIACSSGIDSDIDIDTDTPSPHNVNVNEIKISNSNRNNNNINNNDYGNGNKDGFNFRSKRSGLRQRLSSVFLSSHGRAKYFKLALIARLLSMAFLIASVFASLPNNYINRNVFSKYAASDYSVPAPAPASVHLFHNIEVPTDIENANANDHGFKSEFRGRHLRRRVSLLKNTKSRKRRQPDAEEMNLQESQLPTIAKMTTTTTLELSKREEIQMNKNVDAHGNKNVGVNGSVDDHIINTTIGASADADANTNMHEYIRSLERRLEENERQCAEAEEEETSWVSKVPAPALYTIIIVLVLFSAFFSGLTLALMGLDTNGLEIVMSGDDPILARAASNIYPVRKDGNLLLCTLLLGNVAVNTLLGILMADITSGTVGFLSSTALIVVFGEIIPQATFSRYALQVGEKAVPVMKVIIVLFYILAKPLAFCLDKILGHEIGTSYSKTELGKLLDMHVMAGQLNPEEGDAMKGALQYRDMTVGEVMTPLEHTFMLNVEDKLNFETMATIFKTGYSRIPVYEDVCANVIGMLFVKDLIFINPVDETPVRNFVQIFGRGAHVIWMDDKLGDVLSILKRGHCHLALVKDVNKGGDGQDPFYEIKGIITLEDIIEIILGDQIVDETDAWVDAGHTTRVKRTNDFEWARLRLLDAKIVDQTLTDDELRAVAAHLSANFSSIFDELSEKQLLRMIAATPVKELDTAAKEVNEFLPADLMYEKNAPTDKCTFILGGKVTVIAGNDNFRSDVSSWSLLASAALQDELYRPDFSAYVSSGPCRCLQFSRDIFDAAIAASELERLPPPEAPTGNHDLSMESVDISNHNHTSNPSYNMDINTTDHTVGIVNGNDDVVKQRGELLKKLLSTTNMEVKSASSSDNNDESEVHPPVITEDANEAAPRTRDA